MVLVATPIVRDLVQHAGGSAGARAPAEWLPDRDGTGAGSAQARFWGVAFIDLVRMRPSHSMLSASLSGSLVPKHTEFMDLVNLPCDTTLGLEPSKGSAKAG